MCMYSHLTLIRRPVAAPEKGLVFRKTRLEIILNLMDRISSASGSDKGSENGVSRITSLQETMLGRILNLRGGTLLLDQTIL